MVIYSLFFRKPSNGESNGKIEEQKPIINDASEEKKVKKPLFITPSSGAKADSLARWRKFSASEKATAPAPAKLKSKPDHAPKPDIIVPSITPVVGAKSASKSAGSSTASAKPNEPSAATAAAITAMRAKPTKPKMDLAKALSLMGFGTTRSLDPSGSRSARSELNAALTRKMTDFEMKRKKLLDEKAKKGKVVLAGQRNHTADKLRDDVRTLHEAYQFLARKYIRDENALKMKMQNTNGEDIAFDGELDLDDDLHLLNNFDDLDDQDENDNNDVLNKKSIEALTRMTKADRKKTT